MPRLYLVRHGEAAATWDNATDPGLSTLGLEQARAAATALAAKSAPLELVTSPLARARETAAPLEDLWRRKARIEHGVAEVPAQGIAFAARRQWLSKLMGAGWSQVEPELRRWRQGVIDAILALPTDTVVFSHFIAINVAAGAALDEDAVVCFNPANASITALEAQAGRLRLIELGEEAQTRVN